VVRFASAEGLAGYRAEPAVATPVLEEGLTQRDVAVQSRARVALMALGVAPTGGTTPEQMLESPDPLVRAAAAHELTQQPWAKARPLVRRMLADPEPGVRARALEIVAAGEAAQALDAIKLYKLVVDDLDSSIRARTYFQAYAAACALHFAEQALAEVRAGKTKTWETFKVPTEAASVGFTEAVRGVLSHHMVIRDGKIANYHPYPPTPWNASVRDSYGTPGPYEDAVQNTPIFEENPPETFKGIDIMRAVRSFDPCLPCGVHMYLGGGKTLQKLHTPTAFTGNG
jgi:hypothetical protein